MLRQDRHLTMPEAAAAARNAAAAILPSDLVQYLNLIQSFETNRSALHTLLQAAAARPFGSGGAAAHPGITGAA